MQEGGNQIWLKPNADVDDILSIWAYALTVDGYSHASFKLGVVFGELASQKLEIYGRDGIWQGSFEELRCCLFLEQRRWHDFGADPEGDELTALQALFRTLVQRWDIQADDGSC